MAPKKSKPFGGLWGMTKRALGGSKPDDPEDDDADATTSVAAEPSNDFEDAEFEDANEDVVAESSEEDAVGDGSSMEDAGPVMESFESKKGKAQVAESEEDEDDAEKEEEDNASATESEEVTGMDTEPSKEISESSPPALTKSAKKRQRKSDAKAAMKGMKTLIGDAKQGLAEKKKAEEEASNVLTKTETEAETESIPAPEREPPLDDTKLKDLDSESDGELPGPDAFLAAAAAQRTWDTVVDTAGASAVSSPSKYIVATPSILPIKTITTPKKEKTPEKKTTPKKSTPEPKSATPPAQKSPLSPVQVAVTAVFPESPSKKETSLDPYATDAEVKKAKALLAAGDTAFSGKRLKDAARLYQGAATENGSGYGPLLALRLHEGDCAGALATLREAAAVPGSLMHSGGETRDMAASLGRLFVAALAAKAGVSRESSGSSLTFPTPNGWLDRKHEPIADSAAHRLLADARPSLAAGLTLRGLDPKRRGFEGKDGYYGAVAASAMSAAEALRVARPDTKGWRLAARLLGASGRALRDVDVEAANACLMACATVVKGGISAVVHDPLEAVAESEWTLGSETNDIAAESARGVVVAAAAEVCADRVVNAVAANALDGNGSSTKQALTYAMRSLVGCVSATGASGAEAAHGALYRAADAVWALKCLEAHDTQLDKVKQLEKVSKSNGKKQADKDQAESDLARAAVSLASAAAPSNAFGWTPSAVFKKCVASVNAITKPAPELADAMASLVPHDADRTLLLSVSSLKEKAAAAAESAKGTGSSLGNDGSAVLAAADRDRSKFITSVLESVGAVAEGGVIAASSAVSKCPSSVFGDAIASVAGRQAKDSLAVGAETPPFGITSIKWWALNFGEAVLDPFDDDLSVDGVPGGHARDPLPRLLGLEPEPKRVPPRHERVNLDDVISEKTRVSSPPNARARVEARVVSANEAAIAEKNLSTPTRTRPKTSNAAAPIPTTPLDTAAASIRKEVASLRVSLTSAVKADAEAAAASFDVAREKLLRASGNRDEVVADDKDSEGSSGDFRSVGGSLGGASSYRSVGSQNLPSVPASPKSVPESPWRDAGRSFWGDASGVCGDVSEGGENDSDNDFFDTTDEIGSYAGSAPGTPSAGFPQANDEFVSAPATPISRRATGAPAHGNPFNDIVPEALKETIGGLLDRLSDDDASTSSLSEDNDTHLKAFFAAAESKDATRDSVIAHKSDTSISVNEGQYARRGEQQRARRVAIEAATKAAAEASAAASAAAARNEYSSSEARDARDTAVAHAVVRAAEQAARARVRSKKLASKAAQAVADAAALDNLKTLRRGTKMTPRDFSPDPLPTTATAGRSGVRFLDEVTSDPNRAQQIAASSRMTDMPAKLLSRVTQLVTPFEFVAEDEATHLRLFSRDAVRQNASLKNENETSEPGVSWVNDAHTAFTAWAAASVLQSASEASQSRLTQALAEASEEQLRALEAAARAARGAPNDGNVSPRKNPTPKTVSFGVSGKENESSKQFGQGETSTAADKASETLETRAASNSNAPFTVDAALARFDPTNFKASSSSPLRTNDFTQVAESAAVEAARLGPSAREMYYASYAAAMESAAASVDLHDASAVMAAAAGAARSVRADIVHGGASLRALEDLGSGGAGGSSSQPLLSPSREANPARRKADAALARRKVSTTGASPLAKGNAKASPNVRLSTREAYARGLRASGASPLALAEAESFDARDPDAMSLATSDALNTAERNALGAVAAAGAATASTPSIPPDPFVPLIAWTQKQGGRAFAKLWTAELARLGKPQGPIEQSTMSRNECVDFAKRELLPSEVKGTVSLAYLDAMLAVDARNEQDNQFTLTSFMRAARDSARATAAAEEGAFGDDDLSPTKNGKNTSPEDRSAGKKTRKPKQTIGGGGTGATSRAHESAIARVAELCDAAVGTLKRRFERESVGDSKKAPPFISPVSLTKALADVSVTPSDARAALAEWRAWKGYPTDVRFHKFRAAMRPRSARVTERRQKQKGVTESNRSAAKAEVFKASSSPAVKASSSQLTPKSGSQTDEQFGLGFDIGTFPLDPEMMESPSEDFPKYTERRVPFVTPSKVPLVSDSAPTTPTTQTIRTLGYGYRSPGKRSPASGKGKSPSKSPLASGSKLRTARDLKLQQQVPASPYTVAGERAARRAEAELQAALSATSPDQFAEGLGGWMSDVERAAVLAPVGGQRENQSQSQSSRDVSDLLKGSGPEPASLRWASADQTRRAEETERGRVTAVRVATENLKNVNETLRQLEQSAETFELDLERSKLTMYAMESARKEREDAATAALVRRARERRHLSEAEERAEREARVMTPFRK